MAEKHAGMVTAMRWALAAFGAAVLGAGSAHATAVATPNLAIDVSGTYIPKVSGNDPFATQVFDFSTSLPASMTGSYAGGDFTPTTSLSLVGVYTDGSFTTAPGDVITVTFSGTQASKANEVLDFHIEDTNIGSIEVKVTDTTNSLWDVTGTPSSATLSLNGGVFGIDGSTIKGAVTLPANDPAFTGTLSVPEPPAAALLGFGLLAMLGVARRRVSRPDRLS